MAAESFNHASDGRVPTTSRSAKPTLAILGSGVLLDDAKWPDRQPESPRRIRARQVVTIHVAASTITIDLGGGTVCGGRITIQPYRSIQTHGSREVKVTYVSRHL